MFSFGKWKYDLVKFHASLWVNKHVYCSPLIAPSIAASFHTITSWQRLSDASECSFLHYWIKLHLSETFEMKEKLDLDEFLQYGKYQSLRLWIFGPILAFLGAFSYAHTIFLLQDPTDWHCEDEGVISCNDELEGIVNYQSSIIVDSWYIVTVNLLTYI